MRFQHFLLTRFNVKVKGAGYKGSWPPGWLEGRFDLFEKYCVPSIRAQTCQNFTWLVFCDDQTAPEHLERLRSYSDRLRIVLRPDAFTTPRPAGLGIRRFVEPGVEFAISSRLDNDDGLHRRALEVVQSYGGTFADSGHDRWIHNFPRGYKLDAVNNRLFLSRKLNSPFLSLFERVRPKDPPQGALSWNHSTIHERFPSMQDESLVGWLQVIHDANVRNRIGRKDVGVEIEALDEGFVIE